MQSLAAKELEGIAEGMWSPDERSSLWCWVVSCASTRKLGLHCDLF
jgi:hypothetical protein